MVGVGAAFLMSAAWADDLAMSGNPYDSIIARNVFSLVPIPTNPPAEVKPLDPPAKITPNGIMTLFGQLQVLFKVATPPKPGQPPQDQSYVMSEGDRQDGIAVTKIDEPAGIITFDNHGITQEIPLQAATAVSGPAPGSGPPLGSPPRRFFGGRVPRSGGPMGDPNGSPAPGASAMNSPGNANPTGAPGYGSPSVHPANSEALTPEAQVILMEANRQQLRQQGDPTSALIPPTEITDQMNQ